MNEYRTISHSGESFYSEKKSKFIGHTAPVSSQEEAVDFINGIKSMYKDASHNVGAYNIRKGNLSHSSDDGEPAGTAGVPVLETLLKADILDAAIVVTRYYGGTPLGAGGLIRAYSSTASAALRDAGPVIMRECAVYDVYVPYPQYGQFLKLLESLQITAGDKEFLEKIRVRCIADRDKEVKLQKEISDFFHGADEILFIRNEFLPQK